MKRKFSEVEQNNEDENFIYHKKIKNEVNELKKENDEMKVFIKNLIFERENILSENKNLKYFIMKLEEEIKYINLQNNYKKSNDLFNNYIF